MVDTSFFLPKVRKRPTFRQVASALGLWLGLTFLATLVVHFVIVFALPTIGRGVLIDEVIPPGESAPRLYTGQAGEPRPNFRYADARKDSVYCSFDLRDGAVRVSGSLDVPFWSISVHTLSGLVVGSVNHNAASGGELELLVMRPALARDLSAAGAQLPRDALVVEMEGPLGLVRISGLATYNALRPALRDQLSLMECSLATFTFAEPDDDQDGAQPGQQPTAPSGPPSVPQPVVRPDIAPADGG
ncbi:MAG: hypothetical protein ACE360_01895 [Hyphomicrobiales bacterium]|jgi:uncharacterized membrane protein